MSSYVGACLQANQGRLGYRTLDFETDSVKKETARMEAAGARRKYHVKTWEVMEDPSGTPFCVIRKQHPEQLASMETWQ